MHTRKNEDLEALPLSLRLRRRRRKKDVPHPEYTRIAEVVE